MAREMKVGDRWRRENWSKKTMCKTSTVVVVKETSCEGMTGAWTE